MAKVAAITLALLASAASLAWAQNAATGMGGAPAPATAVPGSAAPAGFTIDQKGAKRATATVPAQAGARKAGPLPGHGKDSNPEGRVTASGSGANAPGANVATPATNQAGGTGKAAVGTAANTSPDGSGNKSFFESRSNTNPRANAGAAAKSAPETAPSAGSVFKN